MTHKPNETDPRIPYLFAVGEDEGRRSVLQMFDERALHLYWAFETMVGLPATSMNRLRHDLR